MTLENIVVFDTETGGLDPDNHSLVSIGLITGDGTKTDEFLIREEPFLSDPRAMAIHGISIKEIQERGLSVQEGVERFEAFFEGLSGPILLVGHNVSFDLGFIRRLYRLAGRIQTRVVSHRSLDTHTMLWTGIQLGIFPDSVNTSDGAFKYFGIEPPAHLRHTALGDAVATQKLLLAIIDAFHRAGKSML